MNVRCSLLAGFGLYFACVNPTSAAPGEPGRAAQGAGPASAVLERHALKSPSPPLAAGARGLRVATWNLEWLHRENGRGPVPRGEADYARLRRYAARLDADVIALQEVDGAEAAARIFPPHEYAVYVANQNEPQRTGFAFRKALRVSILPDYTALAVGQLRAGADIRVQYQGNAVRMLSVHLKSGCFDAPLSASSKACQKLREQLPALEAWIDARSREGVAALVLGDFNRRLFGAAGDAVWRELDDSEPADSDLWSPTEGQRSRCWGGKHAEFIDHVVFNRPAARLFVSDSFAQLVYDPADGAHKRQLSDHCPLAVTLSSASGPVDALVSNVMPDAGAPETRVRGPIKGNVTASRRRLYHAPGCPDYGRTQVDEAKGERWFATVADAEAAGWTKAANCP